MKLKVTLMHPISIKDLRKNLSKVATEVENGESFVVLRRSTPCFKIVPYTVPAKTDPYKDIPKADIDDDDGDWETLIDFTEGGNKNGMPIEEFSEILEKVIAEEDGK